MKNSPCDDDIIVSSDEDEPESIDSFNNVSVKRNSTLTEICHLVSKLMNSNILHCDDQNLNDFEHDDLANPHCDGSECHSSIETNTNALPKQCQPPMNFNQKAVFLGQSILRTVIKILFKMFKMARYVVLLIYFLIILVANMPFAIIRNTVLFLKCYTDSPCVHYVPLRLIPAIIKHLLAFIQSSFVCSSTQKIKKCQSQCSNANNSTQVDTNFNATGQYREIYTKPNIKTIFIFIAGLILVSVLIYYVNSNYKVPSIHAMVMHLRSLLGTHLHSAYMLPGEKCMRAGRCCKGYLEGLFRWMSCFITIPIRVVLFIWPKKPFETISRFEGIQGIRNYIDKINEELVEIKEEVSLQGELLLDIQSTFINLAQKVQEKANSINLLKPKIQKSKTTIEKLKKDMDVAIISLKEVITIRNYVDRLQDLVKVEADDSASFALGTMNRLQTSIESEQHRLLAQIENLELLIKVDQTKSDDKNQRLLQRIIIELDTVRESQRDMQRRMVPLTNLPMKYKEMSESLQKDISNKMNEEMAHHEQMSKRTEKACSIGIERLGNDLTKAKKQMYCFVNKTVRDEAETLNKRLRNDISNTLNERTVEIARTITEQALSKQPKYSSQSKRKVKKCSLFGYVFHVNNVESQCLVMDSLTINNPYPCNSNKINTEPSPKVMVQNLAEDIISKYLRLLAADDIGITDYAMESAGGTIVADRSSATYNGRAAFLSVFGLTFGKIVKSIRKIIQPGSLPGECWAFKHDKGHVVIRLAKSIRISHITIDHVPRVLSPDGLIQSAPKTFNVYTLRNYEDYVGTKIGEFEYSIYGAPIQTFYLKEGSQPTQYIQINILSNHGNAEYTCLYRVRIHGNSTEFK